jgi:NADPH:quinone reductase
MQSGAVPPFDILRLGPKNVRILRPIVNAYVATSQELEKYSSELFQMITDGKLTIGIHKTYDLKDVATAHSDIEGRGTTGKLVLKIDS